MRKGRKVEARLAIRDRKRTLGFRSALAACCCWRDSNLKRCLPSDLCAAHPTTQLMRATWLRAWISRFSITLFYICFLDNNREAGMIDGVNVKKTKSILSTSFDLLRIW